MSVITKGRVIFSGNDSSNLAGIFAPTQDNSDTWTIDLCGGGRTQGNPGSRGANLRLAGNEATNGNAGSATLQSGNVSGAKVFVNARASAGGVSSILTATGDYVDLLTAGTTPATNPSGAIRLYTDGTDLKFRLANGTVKTVTAT